MTYAMQPLACDPQRIRGMSERLILSHYENNYGGAVKRLNAITEQLAALNHATAPVFVINGLKREELIASNSMILHEIFFGSLGEEGEPDATLTEVLARDFGSVGRWRAEFAAMGKALGGGSGWVLLTWSPRHGRLMNQWAPDHTHALAGATPITPITWTTAPRPPPTSTPSCRRSTGRMSGVATRAAVDEAGAAGGPEGGPTDA
jgi:Fe-Mn family superoxide dismutase